MSLKIGIVGLPNVGKSTLFRALTKKQVNIDNYPFVTIEPNVGVVEVPDERVDKLARLSHSLKVIHAVVEFVDIAGLVKGAAEGQGLGNKFLSHIREVDAIAEVVRVFEDPNIIHVESRVDPADDIQVIDLELIIKDAETVEKRLDAVARQAKSGDKAAIIQKEVLEKLGGALARGERAAEVLKNEKREEVMVLLNELGLLTAKPRIIVFNASEKQIGDKWRPQPEILGQVKNDSWIVLSAKVEDELNSLAPEERTEYLKTLGVEESGLDQLIRLGYKTLNLMTFFTTGEDETRAWTIPVGSLAPRAGRAIHSDFEQKFIRAEIISYEKLVEAGSYARARELGWLRIEGKEYVVQDGDVIEFRI
jgi:GTP-binding protein YchF